jgi:cytochrome P450
MKSQLSSPSTGSVAKSPYRFPEGLKHNLLWYTLGRLRPPDPIIFFSQLVRQFGDVAHYKLANQHILFVNRPDYIWEVLVGQSDNFVKERVQQRSKMLLGEGMITAEGSAHRRQRQVAQPAFHRQRISSYAETMTHCAVRLHEQWKSGETRDIALEMMHLGLEIVARALFGTELGEEVKKLAASINSIMGLYNYMVAMPAAEVLVNLPLPYAGRFKRARARIDDAVYRMIDSERSRQDGDNLLAMMLAAYPDPHDRSYLRDQVVTIFLAGYETVANALTWTWYLLSQNPEAETKLHRELETVLNGRDPNFEDVSRLRYTEMVLAESMRLYPPAWAMGRKALADFSLGSYYLPKGTTVLMSQFLMHRNAQYFSEPLRFDPERFTPEAKAVRPKLVYFPFGAGPRQCIGESFAWMEGVLVLATIAQKWELILAEGQRVEPQPLITLRPKYGMRMKLQARM